ncbi:MAG: hypothetical protein WBC51_14685 [Vicinamibacterales bacterium]
MKCTRNRKLSFLPIALALLAGCDLVSRDEVARVASPDGRVEAVLVETNGGATTSFGYEVHVVEKGRPVGDRVAWLYGAGRNAQAYGANLKWTGENEIVIEYLEARDQTLERKTVSVAGRVIKVSLRSGVNDPTAPAGGMLYNLELTRGGKAK